MNESATVTLSYNNIATTAGFYTFTAVDWDALEGFTEMKNFWKLFQPLTFQIRIYGVSPASTVRPAVAAFYPLNYIVESPPTPGLYSDSAVSSLTGALTYQEGATNVGSPGRWPMGTTNLETASAAGN